MSDGDDLPYRPCAGIMLANRSGLVFVGQRIDNPGDAWQMPQGGIDDGAHVVRLQLSGGQRGQDAMHGVPESKLEDPMAPCELTRDAEVDAAPAAADEAVLLLPPPVDQPVDQVRRVCGRQSSKGGEQITERAQTLRRCI